MYESGAKSEASLARAVHILTLGAFAWEENSSVGGTDVGVSKHHLFVCLKYFSILIFILLLECISRDFDSTHYQ